MKKVVVLAALVALATVAAPAGAQLVTEPEEPAAPAPSTSSTLDMNLKLGPRSFRFGTRLFGREGYAGGAWLNGETRPDGFSVDGRVERDGKAHNFKLNADIDAWVRRAVRWWTVTDL